MAEKPPPLSVHYSFTKDLKVIKAFVFFSYLYNILTFGCLTFSDIELMMASNTSTNSSLLGDGMTDEKPMSCAASGTNILITYYKFNEWMK